MLITNKQVIEMVMRLVEADMDVDKAILHVSNAYGIVVDRQQIKVIITKHIKK